MPDHRRGAAADVADRHREVAVAIGSGEDDDRGVHQADALDREILDHGIGEQLAAHRLDVAVAGAVGEVELDQLSGADVVDAVEAEAFERMVDRAPLGVEHAGLQGDEHAGFHGRLGLHWWRCAAPMTKRARCGKLYPIFTNLGEVGDAGAGPV